MKAFDYIVVGAGTAGCVLAARLSQDPRISVLLLEAGPATGPADMADALTWPRLAGTSVDWDYRTTPQRAAGDEEFHWPGGKVLGGSSSINGMLHVRADRSSYDAWEAAGATGWNYASLLPFLKRSERAVGQDPAYRGLTGPMEVALPLATDPLWEACFEAAVQAGHPRNEDGNGATAEGVSWNERNVVGGVRQSAADAYLTPAAGRANLTVITDAHVRRLRIEGARCRGVEYIIGGQEKVSLADREVLLTAGAVGTPHLLLLSGIGPGQHLRDLDIDLKADLPGVGANLQDHPVSEVSYIATRALRSRRYTRKPRVLLRTDPAAAPDLQIFFVDAPIYPRWTAGREDGYSVVFSLMTPASRGTVRLASSDFRQAPLIDPNYLADDRDIDRMVSGFQFAREMGAADALAPWRDTELFPGPDAQTAEALRDSLRRSVTTYFHPAGTCRIGSDSLSVVDPELKVHGISGLRVCDASVMPSIVAANTNATVLAIAERAASLLEPGR